MLAPKDWEREWEADRERERQKERETEIEKDSFIVIHNMAVQGRVIWILIIY